MSAEGPLEADGRSFGGDGIQGAGGRFGFEFGLAVLVVLAFLTLALTTCDFFTLALIAVLDFLDLAGIFLAIGSTSHTELVAQNTFLGPLFLHSEPFEEAVMMVPR